MPSSFCFRYFGMSSMFKPGQPGPPSSDSWVVRMISKRPHLACFVFWVRVSPYIPGWPWTHSIAQACLQFMVLLPQLPSTGITGIYYSAWFLIVLKIFTLFDVIDDHKQEVCWFVSCLQILNDDLDLNMIERINNMLLFNTIIIFETKYLFETKFDSEKHTHIAELCSFFFFWVVLEFELRTLCSISRCSTTWALPPARSFMFLINF
jgi:hypothetical protein